MPQAKAPTVRLLGQTEAVFRTAPAAAATVLPHSSFGVERIANRQTNDTANQAPMMEKSDAGDPEVRGPIGSILDLRTVGFWLKHALGAATVGKAVTKQPTNVTGVTVHHASADCTSGNGTLTWAIAGTTLTWAAQAGLAGAAVNVGAGGVFTLESNGGGKSVRVTVNAAALPVANQNDADIAVAATLKAHVFPHNLNARPSCLLEAQSSDIAKYYRFLGMMVNSMGWDILNQAQNLSLDLIGAYEVDPVPGAAFDANPTSYAAVRACAGGGVVSDGGVGLGTVVGGNVSIGNNLTPERAADGLDGAGLIDNGELAIGGSIRSVFDGAGAYQRARDGTSTRLRLVSSAPVGADRFSLALDMWGTELTEKAPAREGRSGLYVEHTWRAHRSAYAPMVVLVNDVAAY